MPHCRRHSGKSRSLKQAARSLTPWFPSTVEDLQVAWDSSTARDENKTSWLLHMRDEALATIPTSGPEYTITQVDEDYRTDTVAFRIFGTMRAPLLGRHGTAL